MLEHGAAPAGSVHHNGVPHNGPATQVKVPPPAATDPGEGAVVIGVIDVKARSRARARVWYWSWLLFATVTSVGGNVIHAWMAAPASHLKALASIAAAVIGNTRYQNFPNSRTDDAAA